MQRKCRKGLSERPQLDEAAQGVQIHTRKENEATMACKLPQTAITQEHPKRHGQWLTVQPYTRKSYRRRCSVCGQVAYMIGEEYTFCPWCGAKMGEEENA